MVYRPGKRGDSRIEGLNWYLEHMKSMVSQDTKSEKSKGQQKEKQIRMATPKMEGKHIKREKMVI